MAKKHWFHGKTAGAKKKYVKKHPRSIFASGRSATATNYREQVSALRATIARLKEQVDTLDSNHPDFKRVHTQLKLAQRKLALLKQL